MIVFLGFSQGPRIRNYFIVLAKILIVLVTLWSFFVCQIKKKQQSIPAGLKMVV